MTPNKTLAQGWIEQITGSTLNDVKSSIAARVLLRGQPEFGGGNFLMAQGLFATLNLLAKVYVLLVDKEERGKCSDINETKAFHTLVSDLPTEIRLGLEGPDIDRAWQSFRNTPAHMGRPKEITLAYDVEIKPEDLPKVEETSKAAELVSKKIAALFSKEDPSFSKKDGFLHCNVDLLARDLGKITQWLTEEIMKADQEHAEKCLDWISTKFIVELDPD